MAKFRKRDKYATMSTSRAIELARPIIDTFEEYGTGDYNQWAQQFADDKAFINNVQLTIETASALENANQPVTVLNECKPARDQVVGRMCSNDPRWLAAPRETPVDSTLAGMVSDFGSYLWDASYGNMHFRKAVENFEDGGMFSMYIYYDPNADMGKGDIKYCAISPDKLRIDPRSTWRNAQDASKIFIGDVLSEDEIKLRYPDFNFDGTLEWIGDLTKESIRYAGDGQVMRAGFLQNVKYYRTIDQYKRMKINMLYVYDPNTNFEKILDKKQLSVFLEQLAVIITQAGRETPITDEEQVQQFLRLRATYGDTWYEMTDGTIRSGTEDMNSGESTQDGRLIYPVQGSTTQIHQVTMGDLMEQGYIRYEPVPVDRIKRSMVIGEKLYRETVMPISLYPIPITMLHHTDTPYCFGDTRLAKSAQEQINKIASIIIAYNVNISALRAFIQKGSMNKGELEKKWGKVGAQFFEYDQELGGVPIIVQLTQMSTAFFQQQDRLRSFIERIYGAYPETEGQMQAPPNTLGGTMLLDEQGLRRTASKLNLIEEALNILGYVTGELIPNVYDERKVAQVIKGGKITTHVFNQEQIDGNITRMVNDITVNRYNLKIVSGSTLPTNQAIRYNQALRLYELGAIKNPTPVIRESGLPNIEEIIETEDLIKQAMGTIEQLNQTVEMLQGTVQTKSNEVIHANEKAILAKTKADMSAMLARANASVLLGKERTNDAVKNFERQLNDEIKNKKNELANSKQDAKT